MSGSAAALRTAGAFLGEALVFIQPVISAAQSVEALKAFLAEMGYDPTDVDANALKEAIADMEPPLTDSLEAVFSSGTDFLPAMGELLGRLTELDGLPEMTQIIDSPNDFYDELFDRLTYKYLMARAPFTMTVLDALGVLERNLVLETAPEGRDINYTSVLLNWTVLGTFFKDNRQWAYDVYGWGPNPQGGSARGFDHTKTVQKLANIIRAAQVGVVYEQSLSDTEKQQFLRNTGADEVRRVNLPFYQADFQQMTDDGTPQFGKELGVSVLPYGDLNHPDDIGLAVSPYAKGGQSIRVPLNARLVLELDAEVSGTGGAYITAQPSGLGVEAGGSVSAEFGLSAIYQDPLKEPIYVFGNAGETNLRVDRIVGTVGGSIAAVSAGSREGDLFIAAGIEGLKATIDVGDDGLLSAVISDPIEVDAGDILMGWRTGRGVYFEGGSSLSVTVPLDLALGPVTLYEAKLALDWEEAVRGDFMVTADLTLGPLYAYAENLGLSAELTEAPDGDGLLGRYDLALGFIPPAGYAVALDAEVLSGGGMLSVGEDDYRGALALQFANFGLSAFAVLNTRLPGGQRGFSLGASIFADINVPLAYGFFLTGVGGVIGINRTVDTEALREVMYAGRMDNLLFPANPIENAATILEDMVSVLPPRDGQHVFGPVARISWGQPNIIDLKLGVVLEVGEGFRLLILGGMGMNLPDRNVALVALNLSFIGEIDPAVGTISFDATLQGSRVLTFTVTGDMAVRTGWGQGITHIASFGGLHPKYPRPSNLPDLRNLSISFGTNNPKITLSGYNAIALNAVMFGARADLYAKGPKITFVGRVAAKGYVTFDALIYFDPFAFDVILAGGLSLLVDGDSVASLGFKLTLQGPNTFRISGSVWVKVFGIKVSFGITHTWGQKQTIALPQINAADELRKALENGKGFEPVNNKNALGGVSFAETDGTTVLIDPVGGMRLTQIAVPLDLAIEKIGEAVLTGPKNVDLEIYTGGVKQTLAAHKAEFVRSHFFQTSESERLRLPSFERHKAGYEFSPDALSLRSDKLIEETYEYEVIEIESYPEEPALAQLRGVLAVHPEFAARFARVTYGDRVRPGTVVEQILKPDEIITVTDAGFVQEQVLSHIERGIPQHGGPAVDVVDIFENSLQVSATLSEAQQGMPRSSAVTNDQVSSYIAAAMFKEAV
jgi:hypothetical protein